MTKNINDNHLLQNTGRFCYPDCGVPGGGSVRDGHLHAGSEQFERQWERRERPRQRETFAYPLLQISNQFFQFCIKKIINYVIYFYSDKKQQQTYAQVCFPHFGTF